MTDEEALRLPKGHPARFLHFYGNKPYDLDARLRERRADADFMQRIDDIMERDKGVLDRLARGPHPFGEDISACAETNS